MKKPSKQVVKKVLRQEMGWYPPGSVKYLDSALLDGGVVTVTYLHKSAQGTRTLRAVLADAKGDVRASYIIEPHTKAR